MNGNAYFWYWVDDFYLEFFIFGMIGKFVGTRCWEFLGGGMAEEM